MPLPSLRLIPTSTALLASALMLTACSGSDPGATAPAATPAPTAPATGQPRPAGVDFQKINDCLKAAGIDVPSGMPSDLPSGMPTDRPTGMPSELPSTMPSGMGAPGQGGGSAGAFNDPEAQDALKACGIDLPTPPTR